MELQVGVKAFLRNPEGKYLLLHRSPEQAAQTKGSWDIVGGRINAGSLLIDNLKREILEETSLVLESEPKLLYAQDIIPNEKRHVVRLTYLAEIKGEPALSDEHDTYKWVTAEEMKSQPDLDIYAKELLDKDIIS